MEDPWDIDEKEDVSRSKPKKVESVEKKPVEFKREPAPVEESMWSNLSTWRFVAVIMLALLIASIFTSGFQFGATGAAVADPLSEDEATTKAVDFINTNLLADGGVTATLVGTEDRGDLYEVKLTILGQPYSSYITKDGRLLFPQGIDLLNAPDAPPTGAQAAPIVDVSADDDAMKGDENAPVTIIEFSDFQCPFCARFYTDTLPELDEKYIKTGKVKLVYRDFPLENIHPNARPAAEAAECAHEQGKYYQFHDKLFENQQDLSVENYKKWAAELKLKTTQFNNCVDSKKYADEVTKDLADGSEAGVTGTPAFFVNGRFISGAQPFSVFEGLIEEALNEDAETDVPVAESTAEETETQPTTASPVDTTPTETTTTSPTTTPTTAATLEPVDIVAKKYRFDPVELRVKKGLVTLKVWSEDITFGFSIPEFDVDVPLTPGEVIDVTFDADKLGIFTFQCSNCGDKETVMRGRLIVE